MCRLLSERNAVLPCREAVAVSIWYYCQCLTCPHREWYSQHQARQHVLPHFSFLQLGKGFMSGQTCTTGLRVTDKPSSNYATQALFLLTSDCSGAPTLVLIVGLVKLYPVNLFMSSAHLYPSRHLAIFPWNMLFILYYAVTPCRISYF